jgi:hypothetical protein
MQFRIETRLPGKPPVRFYTLAAISRIGPKGGFGGNREAPDRSFPRTIRMQIIDLVDSPVVRRTLNKTLRIRKSGKTDDKIRRTLVALENIRTAGGDIFIIIA